MNDPQAVIALSRRVDLTREADFTLPGVLVCPTACEVLAGGRSIRLQPRVMQVLIALVRARGQMVSREALVEVCWGQVAVGDDALNRCIQKLRYLARDEFGGGFAIETVPRLGYRLTCEPADSRVAPDRADPPAAGMANGRNRWRSARLVAIGMAVLATLALGWILATINGHLAGPAHWMVDRSQALVSTPLLERHPAISPDGRTLAYAAGTTIFNRQLFLKHIPDGEPARISNDAFDDVAPVWSADGGRIVYTAFQTGEPCPIMVTAVPAGRPREIARCAVEARSRAVWAPGGGALLFVDAASKASNDQIMRLDLATGRRQATTHPPAGFSDTEPVISPDGRWLGFTRSSDGVEPRMMILNLNSGGERLLAQLPASDKATGMAWSDDARTVFVGASNGVDSLLWAYPVSGGPRGLVASLPSAIERLSRGPRGMLAAEVNTSSISLLRSPGPRGDVSDALDPSKLLTWSPDFSPTGILAMGSNRTGQPAVWLKSPGEPARMLSGADANCYLRVVWSPEGERLALVRTNPAMPGHLSLKVINGVGEAVASFQIPGMEAHRPAWAADGRSVLLPVHDARGWRIWRFDLGRGALPHPITDYGWVSVRTDGDALFGTRASQPGIWRIAPSAKLIAAGYLDGDEETWTLYRGQLIFEVGGETGHPRLVSMPLSGGPERAFAAMPRATEQEEFAIDPASGVVAYAAQVAVDSDIELFHLARR